MKYIIKKYVNKNKNILSKIKMKYFIMNIL